LLWSTQNQLAQPIAAYEPLDRKQHILGITCLTVLHSGLHASGVSHQNEIEASNLENNVIAGTEPGYVVKANIKPAEKIPELQKNEKGEIKEVKLTTSNPVISTYEAHTGPIQGVDASPFHRHLFLSVSSDGYIQIYNSLENSVMRSLAPSPNTDSYLYAGQWSPFRPLVFAVASKDSFLYVYDLEASHVKPAVQVKAGTDNTGVLAIKFNHNHTGLLATGDGSGTLKVWAVADFLYRPSQHEQALLKAKEPAQISELWMRVGGLSL